MVFGPVDGHAKTSQNAVGIAFGLVGISDWSTQYPFIDVMKSARPWVGHLKDQWGGVSFEDLREEGFLDEQGWPTGLPERATELETRILTDQPEAAKYLAGRYHILFDGEGNLGVSERGRVVLRDNGHQVFEYRPGPGSVTISIRQTNADDPIRNIRIVKDEHLAMFEQGARFNPRWLTRLNSPQAVRFMDWMVTNDSALEHWSDLPTEDDFSYTWRGVPLLVMAALANEIGADPWFTLPHKADDELIRKFAELTRDTLDTQRTAHVEYSNEVWNFIFDQAHYAREQSETIWSEMGDGWMQFYGFRAAEVMRIWTEVFGEASGPQLKRIVSVHTGWPELETSILYGEMATRALGAAPVTMFDAYAVTGYFGYELGDPATLNTTFDAAQKRAEEAGRDQGLSRVALREFVQSNQFTGIAETAAQMVREGSLKELTETFWPYHQDVAAAAGLEFVMYEGGTHAAPHGEAIEDERLAAFLSEFNYSQEMGSLYQEALSSWHDISSTWFNAFVDVAMPSKWGSWGALRHLADENPRWDALIRRAVE